jgi:hypothetical protein
MANLGQMTKDDQEHLIEQKMLEILGDTDTFLDLKLKIRDEFRNRLSKRSKKAPHGEVLKERRSCLY